MLLRHEAIGDGMIVRAAQTGQQKGGVGLVAPTKGGHRPLGEVLMVGPTTVVGVT